MTRTVIALVLNSFVAVVFVGCAQLIGIQDLPPLTEDGGLVGPGLDSGAVDGPALVALSLSGIAPAITLTPGVDEYTVDLPLSQESVTVTAAVNELASGLKINGMSGTSGTASEPISLALGNNLVEVVVLGATGFQREYHVILRRADEIAQYAYGKASNTGEGDEFGYSMALSGDTLAVGAHYEDSAATGVNGNESDDFAAESGAVYVFRRSGTMWRQEAYIKGANTEAGDRFGYSVALSDDTLAVAAWSEDSAATGVDGNYADNSSESSGAVYMFQRTGTVWQQETYIKASNTGAYDWFGQSLALSGDTLAVGAYGEDSGATGVNGNEADNSVENSGAVYVFRRYGTVWEQEAYIKASNPGVPDVFGNSLALSGDTLAVAARWEDSAATGINGNETDNAALESGAVYVFRRTGTFWQQEAYVKASNTDVNDQFGWSVALSGDTLAVGAHGEDSAATGVNGNEADNTASASGAVYVFRRSDTAWQQEAYIKASNTDVGDQFGWSVALSGDTLVVGAYAEDSAATGVNGNEADNTAENGGAVYMFRRAGAVWQQEGYIKASNTGVGDRFGTSLALTSDTLTVASLYEDSATTGVNGNEVDSTDPDSGAMYVFH